MIHGHGNDQYKHQTIIADFSSNVWYKGIPDGLEDFLRKEINSISHYPDPDAGELARKIASLHNIPANRILVTNGATEAFYLIAQLYEKKNGVIFYPSFAEYEDAYRIFGNNLTFINIKKHETFIPEKDTSTVWYGNPNNPDGTIIPIEATEQFCKNNPETRFIVDEAYVEICTDATSAIKLTDKYNNLIIVRSMTKAFAIPGIRIGYIVTSEKIINEIKNIKMPWSVSTLAIKAGEFITKNYHSILPNKNDILKHSKEFQNNINHINGFEVTFSECNFFTVKMQASNSNELKQYLISNYGILIRDASNFRGLDSRHFRISVQTKENNQMLIEALKKWSNEKL